MNTGFGNLMAPWRTGDPEPDPPQPDENGKAGRKDDEVPPPPKKD